MNPVRIAYRGNFRPSYSTESHVARSFEAVGCTVERIQEDEAGWPETLERAVGADVFVWTCTYGMAHRWDQAEAHAAVRRLNARMPTAAMHLDKFWDLPREDQVFTEPWMRLSHVFTADGGNQERFAGAGVNHHWMPPAVVADECVRGQWREEMAADVGFCGSWNGYHPEWGHRRELVKWLGRTYGDRFGLWPRESAVRGADLADLYASVKVMVGDSCMVGGTGRYHSDRIPETIGRGGFLIHPWVEGVTDGSHYTDGEHLVTWDIGDWDRLRYQIDRYLDDPEERSRISESGRRHVVEYHTYAVRVRQVLAEIGCADLLDRRVH